MTKSRLDAEILISLSHGLKCSTSRKDSKMTICQKGLDAKVKSQIISLKVSAKDPYIQLANAIDWMLLAELALPDLENTAKGFYWLGRPINLRVHLSIFDSAATFKGNRQGNHRTYQSLPKISGLLWIWHYFQVETHGWAETRPYRAIFWPIGLIFKVNVYIPMTLRF